MKLTTFLVFICSVGLISYVIAGPSSANGGGTQTDSDMYGMPVRVPTTHSGPAFTGGGQGSQSGDSTVNNASSNGNSNSASNGSGSASNVSNSGSNASNGAVNDSTIGLQHPNPNGAANFIGRGQEKVVEISEKDLAAESAKNQEKSEVTKKFEPSILNQGIDEIAKPSTTSKVTDSGAQNPETGAALQSAASEGARSSPQNSTAPAATSPHQ